MTHALVIRVFCRGTPDVANDVKFSFVLPSHLKLQQLLIYLTIIERLYHIKTTQYSLSSPAKTSMVKYLKVLATLNSKESIIKCFNICVIPFQNLDLVKQASIHKTLSFLCPIQMYEFCLNTENTSISTQNLYSTLCNKRKPLKIYYTMPPVVVL